MAFGRKGASTTRFSLLLLEEGEYYFEDFSGWYYPEHLDDNQAWQWRRKGRVKLCSASVIFEPDDVAEAIMRLPFSAILQFGRWNGGLHSSLAGKADIFSVVTTSTCLMKAHNQNHPYQFLARRAEHRFSLNFEPLVSFLPRVQELHHVFTEHSRNPPLREAHLSRVIEARERRIPFDPSWLVNLSESLVQE
ncbi:MAG: hypothetical protein Q8P67_14665, partial [archaeon]|nr:hypothetical protein [archaeon]